MEGFSIVDPRGDTIIYARNVETKIKLLALAKSKVVLDETELSVVEVRLLMNYQTQNFTIGEAFKKGEKKKPADPDNKGSKWEIKIQKGEISSVHFFMEDTLSGIRIQQDIDRLNIKRFRLGLLARELKAHTLELYQAKGEVKISPRLAEKREKKNKARSPWNFGVKDLAMENLDFTLEQISDSLLLKLAIDKGAIETRLMDIPGKIIELDELSIEGASGIFLTGQKSVSPNESRETNSTIFPWNLKSGKLDLNDVDISLSDGMGMEGLEMRLRNLQISQEIVGIKLTKLGFRLNNGFTLEKMEAELKSDSESTRLKMEVKTGRSRMDLEGEARLGFFDLLRNPAGVSDADLRIKDALVTLSDISSFTSFLENMPIYSRIAATPTRLDVQMDIKDHKLTLSDFFLAQNQKFNLSLHGFADFPFEPSVTSGRIDLALSGINTPWLNELLLDSGIDTLFSDTSEFLLVASISDTFTSPEIVVQLSSNLGMIDMTGHLNFENRSYYFNSLFGGIHLGSILDNPNLGTLSGSAHIEGSGLTAKNIDSNIEVRIDSLGYNGYTYTQIKMDGLLRPGDYELILQAGDPAFNSALTLNLLQTDSLLSVKASGRMFAQLDQLHFFTDTLAVETDIEATLIKKPNAFETGISLHEIRLASPAESAELREIKAMFRTDTSRTSLTGEGDFFNMDIQIDKSIHELHGFATSYGNYLRTFVDSSSHLAEQRVAELPGINATSNITNHKALDILMQDTGLHISSLNFSILNEPANRKVRYEIEGTDLSYKIARLGDFDVVVIDSAGVLNLNAVADSSSIFSGPPSLFEVSAQLANWSSLAELIILNQLDDTIYNIEIASMIDSNMLFLSIPSRYLVLNHDPWYFDSTNFLTIELESFKVLPEFIMRTDSSLLRLTTDDDEGGLAYRLHMDEVRLSSFLWDDLINNKPEGYLSGAIDVTVNEHAGKRIDADLNIRDASYSDLKFNKLLIDGFVAISDSGLYSTRLFSQLDSSTIMLEGEDILGENRILKVDYSHIPLETIQPFTKAYLSEMAGYISGNFKESNKSDSEKFIGELAFSGAKLKVVPLNTVFTIPDQSIQFVKDKIVLNDFRVQDTLNKALLVDGYIDFKENPIYTDLNISSSKLQLMNTTVEDNKNFFGNLFVDSKISFKGPVNNPDIDAKILLSRGTKLNFISRDDIDFSESAELVNFTSYTEAGDPIQISPIVGKSKFRMSSVESSIEIDPTTQINFSLAKKIFNINLAIQGGGLLNYNMLNNNQVSLSGRYEISKGSAELNIIGWPDKYFVISKGGYVNWDGKVEDPELKFEAISKVSTS